MAKIKPINMDSDTFAELKKDMNAAINQLLGNMQEFDSKKSALTVKLTISLEDKEIGNDGRDVVVPKFEHKVSFTVQAKGEKNGKLEGDFILENDGKGGYVIKPLSMQMDMLEVAEEEEPLPEALS